MASPQLCPPAATETFSNHNSDHVSPLLSLPLLTLRVKSKSLTYWHGLVPASLISQKQRRSLSQMTFPPKISCNSSPWSSTTLWLNSDTWVTWIWRNWVGSYVATWGKYSRQRTRECKDPLRMRQVEHLSPQTYYLYLFCSCQFTASVLCPIEFMVLFLWFVRANFALKILAFICHLYYRLSK